MARALFGYRHPALACTGAHSAVGRRNGRQGDCAASRLGYRRLVDAQTPARRFRIVTDPARGAGFGPVHGANVELRVAIEALQPIPRQSDPVLGGKHWPQQEVHRGLVYPCAVQVEIGRHSLECARTVEHHRGQPHAVGARSHDRYAAFQPVAVEEGPRLGNAHGLEAPGDRGGSPLDDVLRRVYCYRHLCHPLNKPSPSPYPLPQGERDLSSCCLSRKTHERVGALTRCELAGSSPFKGEARRGMGQIHPQPIPTPPVP